MTRTLPCFKCGKELKPVLREDHNQPYDGLIFSTHGQYGSRIFDEIDGSKLQINVCDACIVQGRAEVLHLEGIPKREWRPWEPDWLPEDLRPAHSGKEG